MRLFSMAVRWRDVPPEASSDCDVGGRTADNHIGNPSMLLWLAEAAGIPKKDLLAAKRSALSGRRNRVSHCALIRKAIPWPAVEDRLRANK
jgi:hypothetical protein